MDVPKPGTSNGSLRPAEAQLSKNGGGPELGLWSDLKTMRWMREPLSSFKMLASVVALWTAWRVVKPSEPNPLDPLLFISYYLEDSAPDAPKYARGPKDILFVLYYVIVWAFVRQFLTIHVLSPLAKRLGVTKEEKLDRFGEQGYAVIYFSFFGTMGIIVMSQLPTWWYRTELYWLDQPHFRMTPLIKRYYLMQLAYWVQQLLVLALRLEKPRKDFVELVIHHIVTIWLVGWSYITNMTWIGNGVFVTMDVSDVFLGLALGANAIKAELASTVFFALLIPVWTYLRHYLNLVILWSVWTQFDLMPVDARRWAPSEGIWMTWWMKYQIFVPILLLQFVNLYWYFLILRILFRFLTGSVLADTREDEDADEVPTEGVKTKQE